MVADDGESGFGLDLVEFMCCCGAVCPPDLASSNSLNDRIQDVLPRLQILRPSDLKAALCGIHDGENDIF